MRISRGTLALAAFVAALAAVLLHCLPFEVAYTVPTVSVRHWSGNAYIVPIDNSISKSSLLSMLQGQSDSNERPQVSGLRLIEDDKFVGTYHSLHKDIIETGEGRYSHWGKDLIFSTPDNSDPRTNGRQYAIGFAVSTPWWLAILLAGATVWAASFSGMKIPGATGFWTGCAFTAVALNGIFLYFLDGPMVTPDSRGYLSWAIVRTLGYGALAHLYHFVFGSWKYLPIAQLNLLLAALFFLAYAVAKISGRFILGWLLICVTLTVGTMLLSATDLLTEAIFSAFLMAHAAFMILYFSTGRGLLAILAGLCLLMAILIKSIGVALIGPVIGVAALSPKFRRSLLFLVLLPAVGGWLVPSAYNFAKYGAPETSHAGGLALGGHVAWAIHPRPDLPYAVEAQIVERSIAAELAKRPVKFDSILDYATYTANEYNSLLWVNMVPALEAHYASLPPEPCNWVGREERCVHFLSINRALMALSRQAIAADPEGYARHVAAHFLALWRDAFQPSGELAIETNIRTDVERSAYIRQMSISLESIPEGRSAKERDDALLRIQDSPLKKLADLVTLRKPMQYAISLAYKNPAWGLSIGLAASCLLLVFSRLRTPAAAFCYCALLTNAYFLGTAMAQPSLVRYAAVVQGLIAAVLVLGLCVAISACNALVSTIANRRVKPRLA